VLGVSARRMHFLYTPQGIFLLCRGVVVTRERTTATTFAGCDAKVTRFPALVVESDVFKGARAVSYCCSAVVVIVVRVDMFFIVVGIAAAAAASLKI